MTYLGPILSQLGRPRPKRLCVEPQQRGEILLKPSLRSFSLNPTLRTFEFIAVWKKGCNTVIPRKDISVSQHDDVTIFFDFLDTDGDPLDISGFQTITWIVAESVEGDILITKSTSDSSFLLPSATKGSALITKAETGQLPITNVFPNTRRGDTFLYHELKGINSGGEQQTMLQGKFYVDDTRISD